MSKETVSKIDSNNALTWPEDSPGVSVDVRGIPWDNINFDMAAYHELLDQYKIGPERKDLHIGLANPSYMPELPGTPQAISGAYTRDLQSKLSDEEKKSIPQKKGIIVAYRAVPDRRLIPVGPMPSPNDTLIHETKHFSQDLKGKLMGEKQRSRREKISKVLPLFGPALEYLSRPEEISARISTVKNSSKHKNILHTEARQDMRDL